MLASFCFKIFERKMLFRLAIRKICTIFVADNINYLLYNQLKFKRQ